MRTYQDWQKVADKSEAERMDWIFSAINDHKSSKAYREARDGDNYYKGKNTTIKRYEKMLFNAMGAAVPDYVSANHKIATGFFKRDVTQAVSVLLGNGVSWTNNKGGEALGSDFDQKIMRAYQVAQRQGAAFGFFNNDHVEIYKLTEFVPLEDEEDGALKAGIRFWQIADNKPLRATMFELDGYTEYMRDGDGNNIILHPKRGYIANIASSVADGDIIYEYTNYPTFPVIPLFLNEDRESQLNPLKAEIDARDLIASGYANDIDDASIIYWTITNCGGMDDADLVQTIDKLRKIHATQLDGDVQLQSHVVEPSYQGREAILTRLDSDLYSDAMAVDTKDLSSRNATATEIIAAYEPLNEKLDEHESFITGFIKGLLNLAGVEDEPTYTRSIIINKAEEISSLMQGALYLSPEYVTRKILTMNGDKDDLETVLAQQAGEAINRLTTGGSEDGNP